MIRFALIVASTLGFFLTAALGNFMVPLLRAFGPGQEPEAPQTSQLQPDSDPDDLPPPATPDHGGPLPHGGHAGSGGRGLDGRLRGRACPAGG